ncbi:MAG: fibrillarin-like rRNA/tRNA 2'-O-methyltransferase [Hadesarchaea archaeon]|nr:fibrillarin-like rRNA/tRNA 2'-O-methyltransferase [Hadesarchaea archaeon]
MRIRAHEKFEHIYWVELERGLNRLATVNFSPGTKVYGEQVVSAEGIEYRIWDPYRSKLAAAILRGLSPIPIAGGSRVLYLGAASGTTASHISDIVGREGTIYCVEISPRPMRDLLAVCERRQNMIPILADASRPNQYHMIVEQVDVIYQDVAQPEQTNILLENARIFLKNKGYAFLALKARSIDVTKEPREIFRDEIGKLERELEIVDSRILEPYAKDHAMILARKK